MTHMKDRLCDFSALVFRHTVVLLLLTHSCEGQSQVIGASQPLVAMVGDDIILPCHLEPAVDATDLTVDWARLDLEPKFVHLRRDGVELQREKHELYMGRTSLFINKLKCGDISLKLSEVKLSDAGTYRCLVPKSGESGVELIVGSVSSPYVEISKVGNGVLLECKSAGWYPEPEVLWLDGEGNLLPAGPAETVRGPDDLYTVSSRVTLEKRHSFTCRVQQRNINQTRGTTIHLSADLFLVQSSSAVRIIICVFLSLMCIVAVCFVVWKWGRDEKDNSVELQPLMGVKGDGERPMTASEENTYLDNAKAKVDEKLKKNEGEVQHVQEMIETLTEQKKNLKNQREKLISLLQEDKTQMVENEKKLKEKAKTNTEKKQKKREKIKQDLERRKKEHEELLKDIGKLLDTTEEMINKITERKGKLERDQEQIKQHLREIKRQREEEKRQREEEEREEEEKRQREEEERQREEEEKRQREEEERQREEEEKRRREEEVQRRLQLKQPEREDEGNDAMMKT